MFFTDANPEATAIIYRVDDEKELKPIKNSKIYAFFPTAKESHQNFYIHAPFDTTPARDNFKEGDEYGKHNVKLIKNVGELIWFSLTRMREHGFLTATGLNTIFPIYRYEEDDILYGIYQNSINIIKEEAILPTNHEGEFKRITDLCMPLWGSISDIFDDEDLRRLCRNPKLSWIAKEFSTDAFSEIRNFLKENFQVETLDWKNLVLKMDVFYLKQKDKDWMARLMGRIENYCIRRTSSDSHFMDVSRIPFIRTTRGGGGEQICSKDENGEPLVYLNNPDSAKYKIEQDFLNNEIIKSFYQRVLGVVDYNIEQVVIHNVLPKYITRDIEFATNDHLKENINDLKIIKEAIYFNSRILEEVQDKYILTDGKGWYRPKELYLRSDGSQSGYALVKGLISIKYLSDQYWEDLKLDDTFFRKLGCSAGLRAVEVEKGEYLKAVRKYQGIEAKEELKNRIFLKRYITEKWKWGHNFEGFPEVFENITKEKSVAIAKFLNAHAMEFDIKGELTGADDRQFSGSNVDSTMAYSMIGLQLCFEKWIYIKGDDRPHIPSDVDKDDLIDEYKPAKRLMNIIPFRETKSGLAVWLEENIKDRNDAELVKQFISSNSSEDFVKLVKAAVKHQARKDALDAKRKPLKEVLAKGDKKQSEPLAKNNELEVNPISAKALAARTENLDKELAESLDFRTSVASGLSFASHKSNKEERLFLEQEYDGHCQICLKQIRKHGGRYYFEAINILKYSELPQELGNSSHLGWNSLCLCPNCAVEYSYCSKKVSGFYDQVMQLNAEPDSEETVNIDIEMPLGEHRKIYYSPRHFIALKEAFKIFADKY